MKVAFVTNHCAHYRVKTFEILARYSDVKFLYFSDGGEWYWHKKNDIRAGEFHFEYLPGFRLGHTRITPTLPWKLWEADYEMFIKCINGRFALPITYLVARLRGKPFILWTGVWMRLQTLFHILAFPLTRYIYRHSDAIVVYGEHVKRYLIHEGVPPERIFVTTHAVDNAVYNRSVSEGEKAALRKRLGITPEQKLVLYLGRIVPEKGLSYLIAAFASLNRDDAVLVLAGDGPLRYGLEQIVRRLRLNERVRFAGHVPPEQTVTFYALAWVFVLPSVTTPIFKEPWGLVVNEAFNQGLPVIATDSVGAAAGGLVQNGFNGFVVPERNYPALAEPLNRILSDPDLREKLGKNARNMIVDWNNEQMVSGFRQAIEYAANAKILNQTEFELKR